MPTILHPHAYFQPSRLIQSSIDLGHSVLLSAPSGSRIAALIDDTASRLASVENCQVIRVELQYMPDGSLHIQAIWAQLSKVLKYQRKAVVTTSSDFGTNLYQYCNRQNVGTRLALMIEGVRSDSVQHVYELVVGLHSAQSRLRTKNKFLQFVICDHFALRFHIKRNLPIEESELYLLDQIEAPVFEETEIVEGLSLIKKDSGSEFEIETIGRNLFDATGGHYSLLMLIMEHLLSIEFKAGAAFWRNDVGRIFENSDVVKKLRQVLVEDREGIVETAIKYTNGLLHEDFQSPRTMKLRGLGVLYVTSDYRLKLCGGFVRKLLEAISEEKSLTDNVLGTFQTFSGLTSYDGGEFKVTDSDLVFLHVSDLHVGGQHAFKIQKTGRRAPSDRGTVAEYVSRDLEKLNLTGRVDGLLISGDITCRADPGEFARAVEIIREIAEVTGVPGDRIALVPGNHDIQWQPDEFSEKHGAKGTVSRENFDTFYRNVIGRAPEFPEIRSFFTRDGSEVVDLVCLDSNYVEGPEAAGIGMIDPNALRAIGSKLVSLAPDDRNPRRTVWFMSHHHYLPVCDVDVTDATGGKVSVMANASHVLSIARDLNVEVILHGHQHQPFLCYASRWMGSVDPVKLRPILIVGAGSLAVGRDHLGPISQNHYFLLIRQKDCLVIRSRKIGEEGLSFTPHDDFSFARPAY